MINRVVPARRAARRDLALRQAARAGLSEALRWGKQAINRSAEITGLRAAIESGADALVALYATQTEVGREFGQRVQEERTLRRRSTWRRRQFRE